MGEPEVSYEALPDIDLAALIARRDAGAIRCVTTRNNQRLFRAAWSVLRNHTDAEDVVQLAYLKAFKTIDTYLGDASLATWLTRITINIALDHKRKTDRRRMILETQDVTIIEDHRAIRNANQGNGASPEQQLARAELAGVIKTAIAELPDDFRLVFVLRDIEGMSIRQTADAIGLAAATVKTRHFRARRLLREKLHPMLSDILEDSITFAGANCVAMTARVLAAFQTTTEGKTSHDS